MCFSATASFGMSAVLLSSAVFCIGSAFGKNKRFLVLAVMPIIFSVQQFFEGWVWTGVEQQNAFLAETAALVFLFFALAFWPFWIPFCAFILEPGGFRKWLLGFFALLGLAGGMALYVSLLINPESLVIETASHSVYYDITRLSVFQLLPLLWCQVFYVLLVATPPLIGPTREFFNFGVATLAAAAVSHTFFWYATASVWCFFAAFLSLYLCYTFWRLPAPVTLRRI